MRSLPERDYYRHVPNLLGHSSYALPGQAPGYCPPVYRLSERGRLLLLEQSQGRLSIRDAGRRLGRIRGQRPLAETASKGSAVFFGVQFHRMSRERNRQRFEISFRDFGIERSSKTGSRSLDDLAAVLPGHSDGSRRLEKELRTDHGNGLLGRRFAPPVGRGWSARKYDRFFLVRSRGRFAAGEALAVRFGSSRAVDRERSGEVAAGRSRFVRFAVGPSGQFHRLRSHHVEFSRDRFTRTPPGTAVFGAESSAGTPIRLRSEGSDGRALRYHPNGP